MSNPQNSHSLVSHDTASQQPYSTQSIFEQDGSCPPKLQLYHTPVQETPPNTKIDHIIQVAYKPHGVIVYYEIRTMARQGITNLTLNSNSSPPRSQNFYTKTVQVVIQARLTYHEGWLPQTRTKQGEGSNEKNTDKEFNLEMEDMNFFKDELEFWRTAARPLVPSSATHSAITPPPMIIELYLDTSKLNWWQILVVMDEIMQMNRVDLSGSETNILFKDERFGRENRGNVGYRPKSILLERWMLTLNQSTSDPPPDSPAMYRNSIIFFRSLYSYVRLLPAFQLQRRLRKINGVTGLRLGCRLVAAPTVRNDEIPIDVSLVDSSSCPTTSKYNFGAIDTPLGVFTLQVVYRQNCDFYVDDSEHHLSSRFIDMDNNYSKPTMAEYRKELGSVEHTQKRMPFEEVRSNLEINTSVGETSAKKMPRRMSRGSKQSPTETLVGSGVSSVIPATTPSPQSSYLTMDLERLNAAKVLLKSRLEENPSTIGEGRFACNKLNFPYGDTDLKFHLTKLQVPELSPFLTWIPLERFDSVVKLGRGGFAQVYKGTIGWETGKYALTQMQATSIDSVSNPRILYASYIVKKKYALKEITPAMAAEVVLAVLLNFVRITVNLIGLSLHPDTGKYLLVMDCADGNLEEYSVLDRTTNSTFWARVWRICNELLCHLINMHEAHILHHDLHPGNVVLDHNEMVTVRLIDIGLGKVIGSKLKVEGVYGRLDYLPPEQFKSEPYTEASEIYCLGTLMWQTITGVPPRGTAVSIQKDSLREDIPPSAPDTLMSIIRDCWNPNPSMRPRANDLIKRMVVVREEIVQLELLPETKNFILSRRHMHEAVLKTLNSKLSSTADSSISFNNSLPTIVSSRISFVDRSGVSVTTSSGLSMTSSQFYTFQQLKTMNTKQKLMTTRDLEDETTAQQTQMRREAFSVSDDGSPTILMHLANSPSSWKNDQPKNSIRDKVEHKVEDHFNKTLNSDRWSLETLDSDLRTLDGLSEDNITEKSLATMIMEQPSKMIESKDGLSEDNVTKKLSTGLMKGQLEDEPREDHSRWVKKIYNSDIWSMEALSEDNSNKESSTGMLKEQSQDVMKLIEEFSEDNTKKRSVSLIQELLDDVLEGSEEVEQSGAISYAIQQLIPLPPVEAEIKATPIRRLSKFFKRGFRQEGKNRKDGMRKWNVSWSLRQNPKHEGTDIVGE